MKKLLLSLGAFSLAVAAPVVLPTAASAEPATDIVEFCKAYVEANGSDPWNQGECVQVFRSDPNAFAAVLCGYLRETDQLSSYGFKNQGDCVSYVRSLS